jgi:hypothetical protein
MLFAAMDAADAQNIAVIIAAAGLLLERFLAYRREERKLDRAEKAEAAKIARAEATEAAKLAREREEADRAERRELAKIEREMLVARYAAEAAVKVEAVRVEAARAADKVEEVRAQATVAARGVDEVKATLKETTEASTKQLTEIAKVGVETQKTTEAVHVLVNSAMSKALNVAAVALRRVATLTKDPEDEKAAKLAEAAYRDHEAKQRIVDSGEKLESEP